MKLTKKLEAEMMDVYEAFWGGLLNVDIETYAATLDSEYRLIGTTDGEVFFNKKEAIKFLKDTADQVAGNIERRKSKIKIESINGLILITEQFDAYALIEDKWTFYAKTRVSTWMQKKSQGWKLIQQHFSFPDAKATQGETIGLEKISKENLELRDAIKRRTIELENKNRELEIETALERLRAVAMSMRKPEDLPGIGETLFAELKSLGFTELRNTEIIIISDAKETLTSYYYSDYGVTGVVEVDYKSNPKVQSWVDQLKKANDAFAEVVITEKEIKAWRKYREEVGHLPDPKLNKAKAVYYYSYSIGTGGLSISTFKPAGAEQIKILERFRNVFNLSYQRYIDIAQAEAQAREAQIQLALERVRARTMAMQRSDELMETAVVLFDQLNQLGENIERTIIGVMNEEERVVDVWATRPDGSQMVKMQKFPIDEPILMQKVYVAWRQQKKSIVIDLRGEELESYFQFLKGRSSKLKRESFGERRVENFAFFSKGMLGVINADPNTPATVGLYERFAAVFEQTYTRFLDLQKAEAQAREAQIETALERVRSRSMAMQKSEELKEVIQVVYEQFAHLNIKIEHTGFVIDYKARDDYDIWIADPLGVPSQVTVPYFDSVYYNRFNEAKEKGEDFFATNLSFEEKNKFYQKLFEYVPGLSEEAKKFYFSCPGLAASTVLLENVCLYIENFSGTPYTDEENNTLMRFGKVFQQTYTRFLDLKKAEAQAREAQIEASLERVRASAMAMHHSDELSDVLTILFEQFDVLNIRPVDVHLDLFDLEKNTFSYRATGKEGKRVIAEQIVDIDSRPEWQSLLERWKKGKPNTVGFSYYPKEIIRVLMTFFPDIWAAMPPDAIMNPEDFPDGIFDTLGYCKFGYIGFHNYRNATEEEKNILIRFANEFERLYQRFLDLQKAEAQAREAQIELGLERVRARAMAMQHSDELKELIGTVYNELTKLDLAFDRCLIWVMNREDLSSRLWMANAESQPVNFYIPHHDNPPYLAFVKAWKDRNTKWQYDLHGQLKKEWDGYVFNQTEMKHLPDPVKKNMQATDRVIFAASFHNFGCLQTAGPEPLEEEQFDILNRFAKVFDLTYTRFNDLKQAEAQAREAQIELGLERVRARAMAMQHSDELSELVDTVFKELTKLDFALTWCIINIIDESSMSNTVWAANPDINKPPESYHMLFEDYPFHHAMMKGWKERKTKYVYTLEGSEKKIYDDYLFNETEFKRTPEAAQAASRAMEKYVVSFSFSNFGGLQTVGDVPLSDANLDILSRFGKVFDLTYTRFNDLKQAEAQARESQIQLALERVRARTMAMQKSDELPETSYLLFQQVKELGLTAVQNSIGIVNEETGFVELSTTVQGHHLPHTLNVPIDDPYVMAKAVAAWKAKSKSLKLEFEGQELKNYNEHRNSFFETKVSFPKDRWIVNIIFFSKGWLSFSSDKTISGETFDLLNRFATVFEQTYTRFNDLKQAEEQARESQIQLALERVRARTMAMQKSDELKYAATLLFQQAKALGVPAYSCGYNIWEKGENEFTSWMSTQDGSDINGVPNIPLTEDANFIRFVESKQNGESFFVLELRGERMQEHYEYLKTIPAFKAYFDYAVSVGFDLPQIQIHHVANFSQGNLLFISLEPCPEFHDVFKRFAAVFEQTYTRFLDLQKAETQARETIKQASVDRVRAEIASMRTTNDLERIQPLLWNELTTLGVPFIRCGVFIMDEEKKQVQSFLSTPDGKSIAAFRQPYNSPGEIARIVEHWHQRKMYKQYWNEAQFIEFTKNLVQQGAIISGEKYITENRPTDLYLHFLPFLQGMLYVGSTTALSDDDLQLVQNLADAFSTAYARYEDFSKLELAKEQIENTLFDLKQTQAQLVQSEKMASLGELTAGIAHEIQNPLNFVNNFSEVNKELLAEMNEEIEKGNLEEVKALAKDVSDNEEKINHHGKRADAIVKGMLQHSRSSSGVKEPADINVLADEYLRLAYHGLRAKDKSFNATMKTDYDETIGKINIVPQDVGRSVLNLITNAFYAVTEKKKQNAEGYEPTVTVTTKRINARPDDPIGRGKVEIRVVDNGNGIPQKVLDKIFQPFFTTKPTGQGTGLGLSLSYDIVKAHNGELKVETNEGEGSEFIIFLPANN
jgi:signal transduction histidine kinase/DNA-directed RNA polymerase subunit N (RpoN/RPB10)